MIGQRRGRYRRLKCRLGYLASIAPRTPRIGGNAHRGAIEKRSLLAPFDLVELSLGEDENVLGGVVGIGLRQTQAAQQTPNEIEVLVNELGECRRFMEMHR